MLFKKFHFFCKHEDGNSLESILWSEWLVLIASKTQLNRKNMMKVFQFLDYKTNDLNKPLTLKTLEKAYRPHIFRLKVAHGKEKKAL